MTEEEKERRSQQLARAREIAAEKRAAAKAAAPAAMPEEVDPPDDEPEEIEETFEAPGFADEEVDRLPISEPPQPLSGLDRFLLGLDASTRDLLDDAELRVIYDDQQLKAREERRAAAKKAVADRALTAARIAEGIIKPATAEDLAWKERMAEIVEFEVDMPGLGEGLVDIGQRIDQKIFLHGRRYRLSRAQFDSMRDMQYRAQQAELAFEGKDRRHWLRRQARGTGDWHINLGEAV